MHMENGGLVNKWKSEGEIMFMWGTLVNNKGD